MDEAKENFSEMKKDPLKKFLILFCFCLALLLSFGLGVFVGVAKAKFSYRWAESYHKNFAGPRGGFFGNWREKIPFPGDFFGAHGLFGEIIKLDKEEIIIKNNREGEVGVLVNERTTIFQGRTEIKPENLKIGDWVVVIGSPNDQGKIEAKFIRVFSSTHNN